MKKPFFFLIVFSLAFGGLLQGCDEKPISNQVVAPGDPSSEGDDPSSEGDGLLYLQTPDSEISNPSEKILLVLVFDRSASMKTCDPEMKNSKSMAGALLQMLYQYYLPNPFAPAPANAPDVLVLDYPRNKNSAFLSDAGSAIQDNFRQRIENLQITSDSNIFFAQMFGDVHQVAIAASKQGYTRVVSLVWTDGSFALPGGTNNQAALEKEYREEAESAFDAFGSNIEVSLFFPCALPGDDDGNFWLARQEEYTQRTVEKAHILFPLNGSFGESWLKPLPPQPWFSQIFPGAGKGAARQKLIFYYDGSWHDFSSGKDVLCPGAMCQFATLPTSTGFVAGMTSVGVTESLPNLLYGMNNIVANDPILHFWQRRIYPASGCSEQIWNLEMITPPTAPVIFWWRGQNDLETHLKIISTPSLQFTGAGLLAAPNLEVSLNADHLFLPKNDRMYVALSDELQAWLSCYQPVLQLGGNSFSLTSLSPEKKQDSLKWTISVSQIDATVSAKTRPVAQGQLRAMFRLEYGGADAVSQPPNPQTSVSFSIPVTYLSSVFPETAFCVENKQSGFGQGAKTPFAWSCFFDIAYAAPEFHGGNNPMRVWFDYENPYLCLAQDEQTAVSFSQGFQDDGFRIQATYQYPDPPRSTYQLDANCHPVGLNLDFGDGQWRHVGLPVRSPTNPLTPLP